MALPVHKILVLDPLFRGVSVFLFLVPSLILLEDSLFPKKICMRSCFLNSWVSRNFFGAPPLLEVSVAGPLARSHFSQGQEALRSLVPSVLQVAGLLSDSHSTENRPSLASGNFRGFSLDSGYSENSSSVVRYGSLHLSGCFQLQYDSPTYDNMKIKRLGGLYNKESQSRAVPE